MNPTRSSLRSRRRFRLRRRARIGLAAVLAVVAAVGPMAGPARALGPGKPALARYTWVGGALDGTFGTGGLVQTDLVGSSDEAIRDVALMADGGPVGVGYANSGGTSQFLVVHYSPAGALLWATPLALSGTPRRLNGVAVVPAGAPGAGKVVAAGYASVAGSRRFALARLLPGGGPDPTCDGDGVAVTDLPSSSEVATSVAVLPSGTIVVAGYAVVPGSGSQFAIAWYSSATCGLSATVFTDFGPGPEAANDLVLQPDGTAVAVGYATVGGARTFAGGRYVPGGLDPTCDGDGTFVTDIAASTAEYASGVAFDPGPPGRLVAAGTADVGGDTQFAVARYTMACALDATFSGGVVTTPIGSTSADRGTDMAVVGTHPVVSGWGRRTGVSNEVFELVRYEAGGALDASFGTGGIVQTIFPGSPCAEADAVLIQPDLGIVAGGRAGAC